MTHATDITSTLKIALHEAASRGELHDDVDHLVRLLRPAIDELAADAAAASERAAAAETAARIEAEARARDREHLFRLLGRAEAAAVAFARQPPPSLLDQPTGCFVYFLWSAQDELLYVGMSTNIHRRLGEHFEDPHKRLHVHHITLLRCEDERQMRRLETVAIREHRPRWNIVGMEAVAARG